MGEEVIWMVSKGSNLFSLPPLCLGLVSLWLSSLLAWISPSDMVIVSSTTRFLDFVWEPLGQKVEMSEVTENFANGGQDETFQECTQVFRGFLLSLSILLQYK